MAAAHLPITGLPRGAVSPRVIVCGDPARADRIAERLDNAALLSHKREYRAQRGTYQGQTVTVCSHGIGAPGAAVAFEELIAAGAQTIIRVGTCGGLQPGVQSGHLVIASAAINNIGYGREVVPDGYPAVADGPLTGELWRNWLQNQPDGAVGHRGLVLSRDGFYAGVDGPAAPDYGVMSQAGVLAVEMECAALFLVGSLRQVATAAILAADGNVLETREGFDTYAPSRAVVQQAVDLAITCALETLGAGA